MAYRINKWILSLSCLLVLSGCGVGKKVAHPVDYTPIQPEALYDSIRRVKFEPKSYEAKFKVNTEGKSRADKLNGRLRIQKGEKIWVSLYAYGVLGARFVATPDSLMFYEKNNKSWFKGSLESVKDKLGIPLDYEGLEALLLGNPAFELDKHSYKAQNAAHNYQISYKRNQAIEEGKTDGEVSRTFDIDPQNFKVQRQQFEDPKQNKSVGIIYQFHENESGMLPLVMEMILEGEKKQSLELVFSNQKMNKKMGMPFKIPKGYTEMKQKKN